MDIYGPSFSSSQVAKAAGMTHSNFRAHLARGNWRIIGKAQPAEALGKGHLFTILDAVGYALAAELIVNGLAPKEAFDRAMLDFAHVGDMDPGPSGRMRRKPGGIFDVSQGLTLFVFMRGAGRGECYASSSFPDVVELLFNSGSSSSASAIIVNLNDLRARVFHSLGLDERDYE